QRRCRRSGGTARPAAEAARPAAAHRPGRASWSGGGRSRMLPGCGGEAALTATPLSFATRFGGHSGAAWSRERRSAMVRSEADVERLVRENQQLVYLVVNRYLKRYAVGAMEPEDLASWGLIGLMQAARAWDPERGAFSTVAYQAIEWMILRGV